MVGGQESFDNFADIAAQARDGDEALRDLGAEIVVELQPGHHRFVLVEHAPNHRQLDGSSDFAGGVALLQERFGDPLADSNAGLEFGEGRDGRERHCGGGMVMVTEGNIYIDG